MTPIEGESKGMIISGMHLLELIQKQCETSQTTLLLHSLRINLQLSPKDYTDFEIPEKVY